MRARFGFCGAFVAVVFVSACGKDDQVPADEKVAAQASRAEPMVDATFVGGKTCATCHAEEMAEWHGSDHDLAMQPATAETVLGNFDDVTFEHFGVESKFWKKDGEFFVKTPNSKGEPTEYKIDYAFGHYPLQQYLIAFPGGRYQALNICWDSRKKEEGGQRWYHLYPDEKIAHDDILHWTGQHFNWNYMCADCHSTKLEKNYDRETNTYHTTWSEMDVSCEACHGPGSEHVAWAKDPGGYKGDFADIFGLAAVLKEKEPGGWVQNPKTGKPERSRPLESDVQVEACARCHARRSPIVDKFVHGQRFEDTHLPALLDEVLYHHDGQIKEEVYVHGSFVQSKMFHKGVRCTDCHNPHTLKLRATGNALCAQCHVPTQYDTPAHHFHPVGSTGAQCVDCHMPETHYMVVDPRRDHSIRIPRPDLSEKFGSPNACNQCHADQTTKWAADALATWLKGAGRSLPDTHYGEVFAAGRAGERWAEPRLADLVDDPESPAIVRATALSVLRERMTPNALAVTTDALDDSDPSVRESALVGLEVLPPAQRVEHGVALLTDPVRAVRIRAARVLAPAHVEFAAGSNGEAFASALEEYKESLVALADRPGSHMGFGLLFTDLGDPKAAEAAYRQAVVVDPLHIESRLNLAEMLFRQGRVDDAGQLLLEAVQSQPDRGVVHEALGRHLVRVKDYRRALISLAEAVRLMPDEAHIHFFYGVALNQLGQFDKALPVLKRAHEIEPENVEYLSGLATICRDAGELDLALGFAQKLIDLHPEETGYVQLYQRIQQMRELMQRARGQQ